MLPLRVPVCTTCGGEDAHFVAPGRCERCPTGEVFFKAVRATTAFDAVARTLVMKLKYSARLEYAPVMAAPMAKLLSQEFCATRLDALVPVPLHPTRQRERGFNQSTVLAQCIGRQVGLPVCEHVLRRVRATQTQTHLSRRARATNIQNAFVASATALGAGTHIVLIDDVCTTASTLNECARVLKEAGLGEVYCLTFARATLKT